MELRFKKIFMVSSFLIVWCPNYAQTGNDVSQNNAQASRAGDLVTSLFTGQVSYTIPIYTINDPDFPLDIALKYQTEGFKPFQPAGVYGQDWSLVAGGYITRSAQGLPDNLKKVYRLYYDTLKVYSGMSVALKEYGTCDPDLVYNFDPTVHDTCGYQYVPSNVQRCRNIMDYMPDIFYFNFCGHKGCFMIDNNNHPTILSGDFVSVDLSLATEDINGYSSYPYTPDQFSIISIQTLDGYTYIFGGNMNSLEYSVVAGKGSIPSQDKPTISTWHLTQIIAPNGRKMTFQYKENEYLPHIEMDVSDLHFLVTDYDWSEPNKDTTNITYSLHKQCVLHSICIADYDSLTIRFFSSMESHRKYETPSFQTCVPNAQLDSIIVSCRNKILRSAYLSYIYKNFDITYGVTSNYYWRYLSSVRISGIGLYSMNYYNIDPYPATVPPFMHFYTYPSLEVNNDAEYKSLVDRFGFWKMTSLQGLLSNVTLPTGGKIRFTYGNHQYGEERRFQKVNNQNVELYARGTTNLSIGGARIEKIETFSSPDTLIETKTFTYNKPETTNSSGIFYNIYVLFFSDSESKVITNPYNYGMTNSHIGYSHVQQIITTGNDSYKKTYSFYTGHNTYTSVNNFVNWETATPGYIDTTELCSGSLTYSPLLTRAGKLLSIEQYKGNTLQKTSYFRYNGISETAIPLPSYEGVSIGCTDTIVCLSTNSIHIARKLFVFPDVLEQTVTYEYGDNSNNQALVSSFSYSYDTKLRPKKLTQTGNLSRTMFTHYSYPDDIIAEYDSPLSLLVQNHQIGTPVEKVSGYIDGNAEYITSGIINIYSKKMYGVVRSIGVTPRNGIIPLQDSVNDAFYDSIPVGRRDSVSPGEIKYHPYLYQTKSLALENSILTSDYQSLTGDNSGIHYDSRYRLICEYDFDLQNRPLSVKPYGKTATTYTWDGIYPITKKLGNQTWIYTYIPYVGLNTVTDPRGITTYYTYDSLGRIVEEYQLLNGRKQIIHVYQYHIKTE